MRSVDFYFDFGSPNSYLAHKVIPSIEDRTKASFNYRPVLLGGVFKLTNNKSPAVQFGDIRNKPEYLKRENQRFIAKHAIKFQRNPYFPVNTVTVMRGAVVALQEGYLPAYADAIFAHMWQYPKKLDEFDAIKAVLNDAGLDGAHILEMVRQPEVKEQLATDTQTAVDRGVFGCPTFFVDAEMFFGKDRLGQVEEEMLRP